MQRWLTRKLVVRLIVLAVLAFLLIDGLGAPPAHEIHTPGAIPLQVAVFMTNIHAYFRTVPASQSISDVRCRVWEEGHPNTPCPADVASTYLNLVAQAPDTLYVLWAGCYGNGPSYNVEYLPSDRKLVIHCFVAGPWIPHFSRTMGTVGQLAQTLLMVPTGSMGPGTVQIAEDDRLEHLIGDQSTEFTGGAATIS